MLTVLYHCSLHRVPYYSIISLLQPITDQIIFKRQLKPLTVYIVEIFAIYVDRVQRIPQYVLMEQF